MKTDFKLVLCGNGLVQRNDFERFYSIIYLLSPDHQKQSSTIPDDHSGDKKACGPCCTLRRKPDIQDRHLSQD